MFNDVAIAAVALCDAEPSARVAIVDLDVHQGDGTAEIVGDDPTIHTLSIHGRNNFPFAKRASRQDVELDDGTGDAAYLSALAIALDLALRSGPFDLAIYLAGADPFAGDRLGRLAMSKAGLQRRDEHVLDALEDASIPVAIAMAGVYAEDVDDIVDIHFATVCTALRRGCTAPGGTRVRRKIPA